MANYITTATTDPNQTNIRMTTNLMIGADSDPAQELHVTGDGVFTGNITAYYSSDISLKDNIRPIESAIFKVKQIRGVTFDWNEKSNKLQQEKGQDVGLIAQEVELIFPHLVDENDVPQHDDLSGEDTREKTLNEELGSTKVVAYEKLACYLTSAIQELSAKNDALEARIATLESG